MVDQSSLQFTPSDSSISPFKVDNWTSYSYESDFFTPCESFVFEISDDRVDQIKNKIRVGDKVQLYINDKLQTTGKIDSATLQYNRAGGTTLTLKGRDNLGAVADGTISPYVQSQVKDDSTFSQVFSAIFDRFGMTIEELDSGADVSVRASLKLGAAQRSKNATTIPATKVSAQLKHQYKPYKSEGYLQYVMRLCQRNGWVVRVGSDGTKVYIHGPTYDRTTATQFNLYQSKDSTNVSNNILSGIMNVNWGRQPSVILGEATSGGGNFRKGEAKVIYVNDITGYDTNDQVISDNSGNQDTDLQAFVSVFTNQGTQEIPLNSDLRKAIPTVIINANTDPKTAPIRAMFIYDQDSLSANELQFFIRNKMHELQLNFFSLTYVVDGHSDKKTGAIWTPNTMVNVWDEVLGLNANYWVQKRTFTKSRGEGTKTELLLKLPYIFDTANSGS